MLRRSLSHTLISSRRLPIKRLQLLAALLLVSACADGETYTSRGFETWNHRKFDEVVRQSADFTCGAASLATLARFYYDKPVTEAQVLEIIRATYTAEEWQRSQREGLSLLDLKKAAEALGFSAEGIKMTVADLGELNGPVIVHLNKSDIQHFVVLRGTSGDRVMLSDPVFGNSRMPRFEFAHQWTGYALTVWIEGEELPTNRMTIKRWESPSEINAVHENILVQPPPPVPYPQS